MRLALLAAAFLLAFPAAAQQPAPDLRFRYLGQSGDFAVMASEPSGPQAERAITAILANRRVRGPGDTDNSVWILRVDCPRRRLALDHVYGYLGTELRREVHTVPPAWAPIEIRPGSANDAIMRFACTGEANEAEARWITGDAAARAFALEHAPEKTGP